MATSGLLLRLSVLLGLIVVAVTARPGRHFHPCKTLIFISTSPSFVDRNPGFSLRTPSFLFSSRRSAVFYIAEFRKIEQPEPANFIPSIADRDEQNRDFPLGLYSTTGSSFRDRSKDILSIVGSLLFGVGCGALTASVLYLVWALFAYNRYEESEYEFESDESDDDVSPKKMGYVAIPAKEAAPAKEVV